MGVEAPNAVDAFLVAHHDTLPAFRCEDCDHTSEDNGGPLYECGSCGTKFNKSSSANEGNLCSCGKFSSKTGELSCEECNEAAVVATQLIVCADCGENHSMTKDLTVSDQREFLELDGYCDSVLDSLELAGLLSPSPA